MYRSAAGSVPDDNTKISIKTRGKVYSIEKTMEDVLRDGDGIMEVGRIMAGKMGIMKNGSMRLYIDYHIVRK